jgi:pimeloyl-ACP methyl ester carboxylesterase
MGTSESKGVAMNSQASQLIQSGDLQLEYFVYGNGETVVICLHGHGRNAADFAFLEDPARKVIAIHLPFHGNSTFPIERIEPEPLSMNEFFDGFQKILQEEQIEHFHLFAFSQGGRFSLCLLPMLAEKIRSLTLISPDGMDNQSFYNWTSRKAWARALFRSWEKDPKRLLTYGKIAKTIGLMRPKVLAFVREFTSSKKSFIRASQTWRCFREIQPDPKITGKTIQQFKIPFTIIMGSFDQVIRPKQAYAFEKKCGLENIVIEIKSGHNFFKASTVDKFKHLLPF